MTNKKNKSQQSLHSRISWCIGPGYSATDIHFWNLETTIDSLARIVLCSNIDEALDLHQKSEELLEGTIVCLENAFAPELDAVKSAFIELACLGQDRDGSPLWIGQKTAKPISRRSDWSSDIRPIVVSFYTRDTEYESLSRHLAKSVEKLDLVHRIIAVDDLGNWEANCAQKPVIVQEVWQESKQPVLWIDSDAILELEPTLLYGSQADFSIHKGEGWRFRSGTLFLNQTEGAEVLLNRWIEHCQKNPSIWDQRSLDFAWAETIQQYPLKTEWLPVTYTKIFDETLPDGYASVVEHYQQSRNFETGKKTPVRIPQPPFMPAYRMARMNSRPEFLPAKTPFSNYWRSYLFNYAKGYFKYFFQKLGRFIGI